MGEVNKFHEDQETLTIAIKKKEADIENANGNLQELRNQTEIKQQDIRKLKEQFIHKTALKGELNRQNIRLEKDFEVMGKEYNAAIGSTSSYEKQSEKLGTQLRKSEQQYETQLKNNKMVERNQEQLKR